MYKIIFIGLILFENVLCFNVLRLNNPLEINKFYNISKNRDYIMTFVYLPFENIYKNKTNITKYTTIKFNNHINYR